MTLFDKIKLLKPTIIQLAIILAVLHLILIVSNLYRYDQTDWIIFGSFFPFGLSYVFYVETKKERKQSKLPKLFFLLGTLISIYNFKVLSSTLLELLKKYA